MFLQLSFLRGFSNELKFIGVAQGWTLTVEESFYLLFPLLYMLIRRIGFVKTLLAVYSIGILLWVIGMILNYHEIFGPARFMLCYTFFGRASEFFIGMYLAKKIQSIQIKLSEYFTWIGLGGILSTIGLLSYLSSSKYTFGLFHPFGIFTNTILLPIFIGFLIIGLCTEKSRSVINLFLGSRIMILLGKSSYAFYLIHLGVVPLALKQIWSSTFGNFVAINILAIILYLLVEEPTRRIIQNWWTMRVQGRKHDLKENLLY